jgi:hypothetical protein
MARPIGPIQQTEAIREKDPILYEALKRLQEGVDRVALDAGDGRGGGLTLPEGYIPQGVLGWASGTEVMLVPPQPDPETDPTLPADPVDPNSPIPPARMDVILTSRKRTSREVAPR